MTRDVRSRSGIGRDARLELVFEQRHGRTIVAHAYAEPPFRIGRSFDLAGAAHLILVCAGPGVFAGDTLRQSVAAGPGARVVLTAQSALQVHPSAAERPATLVTTYDLHGDAELHARWHPMIPFSGARVAQRVELRLADEARLLWSDALMSGRVSRGETWRFETLDHELRARIGGATRYLERYCLRPGEGSPDRPWVAAGAHYFGTVIVRHGRAGADEAEALHRRLLEHACVRSAVDAVSPGLLVARLMTDSGAAFAAARAACAQSVVDELFESPHLVGVRSM